MGHVIESITHCTYDSVPGITIITDIICGFPTELEEVCLY